MDRALAEATARIAAAPGGAAAPDAEAAAALEGPVERDAVVALAVARSAALAVMAHRARALVHAGRAEGALPSAELGFEAWNLALTQPYALGEADMYMVELRQRFPAAGALDARARAMAEEARAALAELAAEERLTAERAARAFADYAQAFAERRSQERQRALLARMEDAVRARATTGGGGLVEAARIDLEVAKVERALARVAGELAGARATLNAVLRRAPGAPLGEPRQGPPETVRLSVAALLSLAEANLGAVRAADARAKAAAARRQAAEAEARHPEVMVGLGYWQDPGMRPGLGVTAAVSLPWLWGPGSHRVRQAREEEAAERVVRDGAALEAQAEIGEAQARLQALEAQLVVVRARSLPAARRAMEALTATFASGGGSLLEWVDVARTALELEMEVVVLHGELQRAVAALERAVGASLPREPLPEEPTP
jgi:outer membrane protein TolC